jgi:hypothetical protein
MSITQDDDDKIEGKDAISAEEVIASAEKAQSASDLESCLAGVRPGFGNCSSRRKLRRLLEQKLADSTIQGQINAKSRRRFQRVLLILKPDKDGSLAAMQQKKESDKIKEAEALAKKASAEAAAKEKIVPCILFIGQLTFDTTAEEIENYLQNNGITGKIIVRLRRDPEKNQSLGMAFVEVDGPRELRKGLALHHSFLNGRRINVEKSCGGRSKEKRSEKISSIRTDMEEEKMQQINGLMSDYSSRGVIPVDEISEKLMHIIQTTNPSLLSKVCKPYMSLV